MQSEVNIWTIVKSLLHKYECVIVPGLGGFIAHQESAVIDPVSMLIIPPSKHITFNAQLLINDGLLASHLADYLRIDYVEAIKIIDIETNNFSQSLKSRSQIQIDGLGNFTLNNSDNLLFTPEKNANFLIHSFGLAPVKLIQPSNLKTSKIIQSEEVLSRTIITDKKINLLNLGVENQNSKSKPDSLKNKRPRRSRKGLTFTAIGTFLVLILGLNAYIFLQEGNLTPIRNKFDELNLGIKIKSIFDENNSGENSNNKITLNKKSSMELLAVYNPENIEKTVQFNTELFPVNTAIIEFNLFDSLFCLENSTLEMVSDSTTIIALDSNLIAIENIISIPTNTVEPNTYYIIAGAFKNENYALNLSEELSREGFINSEVIINPKAKSKHLKYFVTYTKMNDFDKTTNELYLINENENSDAWIFISK
jgi:hypothetical protein